MILQRILWNGWVSKKETGSFSLLIKEKQYAEVFNFPDPTTHSLTLVDHSLIMQEDINDLFANFTAAPLSMAEKTQEKWKENRCHYGRQ